MPTAPPLRFSPGLPPPLDPHPAAANEQATRARSGSLTAWFDAVDLVRGSPEGIEPAETGIRYGVPSMLDLALVDSDGEPAGLVDSGARLTVVVVTRHLR